MTVNVRQSRTQNQYPKQGLGESPALLSGQWGMLSFKKWRLSARSHCGPLGLLLSKLLKDKEVLMDYTDGQFGFTQL